ncbi:MAG TPA: Imm50 family immunity protein [Chthonomonadales bacterium]|nr:Imm50 family immunity protein [Chthonomonadales bacterium]
MSVLDSLPIQGAGKLTGVFGRWPDFRGARVLYVRVDRTGPTVTVAFELTEWAEAHPGQRINASLRWIEATDLSLSGLDPENVIAGMALRAAGDEVEAVIEPGSGLHGRIKARQLRVLDVAIIEP